MGLKAHDTDFDRWVCVKPAAECKGYRTVYGEKRPCPLYGRCVDDPRNKHEFPLVYRDGEKKKFSQLWPEGWRAHHSKERQRLLRCFNPEGIRAYKQAVQQKYYAQRNINRQKKRHKAYHERDAQQVQDDAGVLDDRGQGLRHYLLPCGEDCDKGCPCDGACPYTDEDEDRLVERERRDLKRAQQRAYRERGKENE